VSRAPSFDPQFRETLLDLFKWRRDVRRFKPTALPEGALERLMGLAGLAPSVGLSQPWRFVRVDSTARREAARACFERCNAEALGSYSGERAATYARLKLEGLREAPAQFAVFVDAATEQGHGLGRKTMPATLEYSAVMAVYTLWLAARAEGIGMGWVSILDPLAVAAILEVPEGWTFIGYFCAGYPLEETVTPTLETAGWESRRPATILER
jgi:5,6-dimethylbenzimidazole synthase